MRCSSTRLRLAIALAIALAAAPLAGRAMQPSVLRIVVLEGEDAVNIVQQKTAVAPVIEVRDENDLPVAGVLVRFTLTDGGKTAAFAGGAQTMSVTTNATGRAAATGLNPLSNGTVQIQVHASLQGQTASVTISQTNFATAAQAGNAGASVRPESSGLSKVAIIGIAAAAGAGAVLALPGGGAAPSINGIVISHTTALQFATPVTFRVTLATPGSGVRYRWDFGDGATASSQSAMHVFQQAGVHTVQVTVESDEGTATSSVVVTVKSLTGRWAGIACWRVFDSGLVPGVDQPPCTYVQATLDVVQAGGALTGSGNYVFPDGRPFLNCSFAGGSLSYLQDGRTRVDFSNSTSCGGAGILDESFDRVSLTDGGEGTFLSRQ